MTTPKVLLKVHYHAAESELLDDSNPANAKKKKERLYYSSKQKDCNDYVKYVDTGAKAGEVYDYIAYAGNDEKSSGIFNKEGLLDDKEKEQLREKLRNTKSVIWDMLISFEEEFGKEKMKSWQDAQALLIEKFPKFFRQNYLNYENIEWFAGLHTNTDNRHIHISFFEKEPMCYRNGKEGLHYHKGELKKLSMNELKIDIEEELTGYKFFMESYRRNIMSDLPSTFDKEFYQERKLRLKILELYRKMPSNGRISYGSDAMEHLRPLVNEITNLIIDKNPTLKGEFTKLRHDLEIFDENRKRICEEQKIHPERYLLKDKYLEDIYRRIGNQVIQYAKKFGKQERYDGLSTKQTKVKRNMEKQNRMRLLKRTIQLTRKADFEANDVFNQYRYLLQKAEHDRLVEQGEMEVE